MAIQEAIIFMKKANKELDGFRESGALIESGSAEVNKSEPIMYEGVNLCAFGSDSASDKAHWIAEKLFSPAEMRECIIDPSKKLSKRKAADPVRTQIFKDALRAVVGDVDRREYRKILKLVNQKGNDANTFQRRSSDGHHQE